MRFILIFLSLFSSALWAMPDFKAMNNTKQRQQAFFNYLLPNVNAVNQSILRDRSRLVSLCISERKHKPVSSADAQWAHAMASKYRIRNFDESKQTDWKRLLERVDAVPISMVLAQSANESAWGTSRFATQGNNLFGQWCFKNGCGIVPKQRNKGMHHEVKKFATVYEAINQYALNLNTHASYQLFRQLRKANRTQQKQMDGYQLAQGLIHYSERKEAYVHSIQAIIKHNHLGQYDVALA